jgi:hypothetical protein
MSTVPQSAIDNWGKNREHRKGCKAPYSRPGDTYPCTCKPDGPHEPGPVERAVEADIEAIGRIGLGRVFMAESARKLARAIDARGDDEAPSALAKAVDSLFKVMNALAAKDDGGTDDRGRLEEALGVSDAGSPSLSPPLRYPKESGPADGGPGDRKSRKRAR